MKNHSGRRSFLRFATSKRNRIISLCILPLVLLLSFLGSSRTVYAEDYINAISLTGAYVSYDSVWIGYTPWIYTAYTDDTITYQGTDLFNVEFNRGYFDVNLYIKDTLHTTSGYKAPNYVKSGYFSVREAFELDFSPIASADPNFSVDDIEILGYESTLDEFTIKENLSTYTESVTSAPNGNNGRALRYNRYVYFTFEELSITGANIGVYSVLKLRVYGSCYNTKRSSSINCTHTYNHLVYGDPECVMYAWPSEANYLYNIMLQQSSGNLNIVSSINNASSQAHSDAGIAQSQAADLIDDINYDHSGTSQTVSATQSAYDAAQGAADAAVDAAVHNYTSDLSTVEAYDYSSFFTSQRNSALFWRDVGEYILDSSNLGFVSGSIIIVTLIGLVIFMLRL